MQTFAQQPKTFQPNSAVGSMIPGRLQRKVGNSDIGVSSAPSTRFAHDINQISTYPSPAPPAVKYASVDQGEESRSLEQADSFTPPSQQITADQGDLSNPRFKGDPELEDCFDRRRFFRVGSQGNAVAKIQSGITDYFVAKGESDPLPVYGSDGKFGTETRGAVVQFQQSVGFTESQVDGVVGHDTMDKLDKEVPLNKPPGVEPPKNEPAPDKPAPDQPIPDQPTPDQPTPDKPAPTDPDEACIGCKPIAKITKKSNDVETIFGLCNDDFDVFNNGPGAVQVEPGCLPQNSNIKGLVTFASGTQNGPAWSVSTANMVKDCTSPPPQANSVTPWELGFIQTLESATFAAGYQNNKFVGVTNSGGRDTLQKTAPAPWYDKAGGAFGPQNYPTFTKLTDTPNVQFNITHPDSSKDFLRSVCMKAKFNIWLIINKQGTAPSESNVDFFYHWSISTDQSFSLTGEGAHPCNGSQWKAAGSQTMSNKGPGKGSAKLIWDQPLANAAKVIDTKATADPCNAPSQPKTVPKDSTTE